MLKIGPFLYLFLILINVANGQSLILDQRASYTTNAYKDKNQASSYSYELFVGNKFANKQSLTAFFYLIKSEQNDNAVKIQNGELRYSIPIAEDKTYSTKIGFRAIIPLSKIAREQQEMQGGFLLNPTWNLNLGSAGPFDFNLSAEPRYYEYFYRYNTDKLGNFMTKRMVMGIGEFVTTIYEHYSLYVGYTASTVWNTNNSRTYDRYSFYQDLEVGVTKNFFVVVGHSDGNFFMTPDGYRNSITLFDEKSTSYYMRVLYSF